MSRDDFYASPFGAAYSAYMERPRLSRPLGRLLWGGDSGSYYESMAAIAEVPDGGTVVDCPCGAGPALRRLAPGRDLRYVAADLSPAMLRRAGRRAATRGLTGVELLRADAAALPLEDGSADLYLSFWGLHCFPDPAATLVEAARVLRPGGRLVGACFVLGGDGLRRRLLLRPHAGDFGPIGSEPEVTGWMAAAGFEPAALRRSGPMRFFDLRLPAAEATR